MLLISVQWLCRLSVFILFKYDIVIVLLRLIITEYCMTISNA
jgi:hypothetical protein